MKIVQVTEDFSFRNTGVTSALLELCRYLGGTQVPVDIVAAGNETVEIPAGVQLHTCRIVPWGALWRWCPSLEQSLARVARSGAVLHIHGIWMYPQWEAMKAAIHERLPFVLTPHNMLGGWLWRRGTLRRIKKRFYWEMMLAKRARRSSVVHALSASERDVLSREFFPGGRIEVIPNGIDIGRIDNQMKRQETTDAPEGRYLLFLGRLHPAKGLERLLDALAHSGGRDRLIVAGPSYSKDYLSSLRNHVQSLGIASRVSFIGPVDAEQKWDLLQGAWAVCTPSYSEGMSMVVLEAMAARTPVISSSVTAIVGWKDGGGLVFDDEDFDLHRVVKDALSWSDAERRSRGEAARAVTEKLYDWSVVGPKYLDLYRGLVA